MKTLLKGSIAFIFTAFVFTSCQKSDLEPMSTGDATATSELVSVFAGEEGSQRLIQLIDAYRAKTGHELINSKNGVEFIPPLFTSDGFGIIKNLEIDWSGPFPVITAGEIAGFSADYDNNDFWRVNNDGTISVLITSNQALAEYIDLGTGLYLSGNSGQMMMKYTGNLIELVLPFGTFYFIDFGNSPSAVIWNGNGLVQENGAGPMQNLVAHLTDGPGQQSSVWFTLN